MLLKTSQKIVAEAQNKIVNALFICYMYTCIHISVQVRAITGAGTGPWSEEDCRAGFVYMSSFVLVSV